MKKNRKGKEEERTFESEIERNVKSGKKDGNSRMTNENHQILRRKSKIQRLKIKYKKKNSRKFNKCHRFLPEKNQTNFH